MVTGLIWVVALSTAEAASLKGVLKQLSNSTDEFAQNTARILKKAAGESDDGLEAAAKRIGAEGAATTDDVLMRLKNLGVNGDLSALAKELDSLGPSARSALVRLVDDSRRILSESGMSADEVIRSLEKGGPDAIFEARKMRSPESLRACLNGFDEYGESFAEFARKADDVGVRKFDELKPQLNRLSKNKLDDILKNPAKYFSANGRPLSALDDLLQSMPKPSFFERIGGYRFAKDGVVVVGIGYAAKWSYEAYTTLKNIKDGIRDLLEPLCGSTLATLLANGVWWVFLLGFAWLFLAVCFPSIRRCVLWLIKFILRLLIWGFRRVVGERAKPLERLEKWSDAVQRQSKNQQIAPTSWQWFFSRNVRKRPTLRLGLLGYRRAGKTTFTVMLVKKLDKLVTGATLDPNTNADHAQFMKMADEVQACKRTADDKRIDLRLVWPFGRSGEAGGKMDMLLEVADFPGEYASRDAKPDERDRLASHLRLVDGLLIVIDPTDLEADLNAANALRGRIASQREAIESMFQEDGLDIGRSFHRAIAIVVTKRDALTPTLVKTIADLGTDESKCHLDEMQRLAAQTQLSVEESHRLGIWILLCLCPTLRVKLETMLKLPAANPAPLTGSVTGRWKHQLSRFRDWLVYPTCPQLQVFCISQMGLELGCQVVEHRRRVQEWKPDGSTGEQPAIRLELDHASTDGMDLHYPFRWLFDQIPDGWLHECAGLSFGRRELARWLGPYRRFAGAPAVQQAITVTWRRVATSIVTATLLVFAVGPVFRAIDAHLDRQFVRNLLENDAAGPATTNALRQYLAEAHKKSTKPYPSALATFESLLKHHDDLDRFAKAVDDEKQDSKVRIEQAAEWLQLQHQLPDGDTPLDTQLLAKYRTRLRDPAEDILRKMKEQCVNLTDRRPSEAEWNLIHEQRKLTEKDGLCRSDSGESVRKSVFEKLTSLCVEHDRKQLTDKIKELLKPVMPDYPVAFRLIDGPEGAKLKELGAEGRNAHDDLRTNTVDRFWSQTETDVNTATDDANINRVSALYRDFRLLAGNQNKFADEAKKREANAVKTVVEARVNRSKREPDAAKKWDLLREVETHLKDVDDPSLRDQWREMAAEAKQGLKEWLAAHRFLSELGDEKRRSSKQDELWRDWIKFLIPEGSQLLENQKVDEVKRLIVDFRLSRPPQNYLDQVDELVKRIPAVELRAILAQVKNIEATNPQKALELLLNASVNIDRNQDADILKQWRQKTVELYQRLDKHPDAHDFLEGLRQKKLPLLPHDLELVDELWRDYVAQSKSQFDKLANDPPRASDAWRNLRSRARDERATSSRESLQKYARDQLGMRLPNIPQNSDPKTISAERKKLDALKQAVKPWLEDKDFADHLQASETRLITVEFANDLNELTEQTKKGGLSRTIHQELHRKFLSLLAKKGLTPAQKSNAESASQKHLVDWEKEDFLKIYNAHQTRDFSTLSDCCNNYLAANTAYVRPDQSKSEVEAIKAWLDRFNKSVPYPITGIKLVGLPSYTIRSNFDPAVEVRNAKTGGTVEAQQDGQYGTVTLPIRSASTLNWKLGDQLVIGIWEDAINNKGECIGLVRFTGDYSLLEAMSQPTRVPYEQFDYKTWPAFDGLRVQVVVASPDKFRPPPITERK